MPHVAIVARVTVKEGKADEYLAAFVPLLEQAEKEPGTLVYTAGPAFRAGSRRLSRGSGAG